MGEALKAMMKRTRRRRRREGRRDWRGHRRSALLLVHGQHPLGDEEAAEDVDRRENEREEAEDLGPDRAVAQRGRRLDADREQAPTTMTEEIALVTDISGVCSAGVTDQTT